MRKWIVFCLLLALGRVSGGIFAENTLQNQIFRSRDKVLPALVHIEPVRSYFSTGERRHTLVTGSGFIFSPEGYVLTNHHVIENAEKVFCTLSNKKKLSAAVIGSDPSTDIAVLKLKREAGENLQLKFTPLGNSDSIEVGQIVLALGSPLGLSRSVSMGVISSIDRSFEEAGNNDSPYNLWIQTDAAINPGNSGGPLINLQGEVIGINARGVFLAENLGFAIPINLAKEIAEKLIAGQKIRRSWIGVNIQPVKDLKKYLDQPQLRGVLVSNVEPNSPASEFGLQAGDVLTAINDQPVNADFEEDLPAIRRTISRLPVEKAARLTIGRTGKILTINIKPRFEPFEFLPEFDCPKWGFVVKCLNRKIFKIQGLKDYRGVFISAVKSGEKAYQAGLREGDVIRVVNETKVKNMEEFQSIYNKNISAEGKEIFLQVLRQGAIYFAVLSPDPE